eukprot:2924336-Rhodomonas_salina.1
MGRHAFPNLDLGANHDAKGKSTSKALTSATEATARQVAKTSTAMADDDSDESLSSWEVEEVNKRMVKRVSYPNRRTGYAMPTTDILPGEHYAGDSSREWLDTPHQSRVARHLSV